MFGLMKNIKSAHHDAPSAKGSVLGSCLSGNRVALDPAVTALVQLSAAALPQMSGTIMTGLERALKIEPQQKPALRKFIADSYAAPQSIASTVRGYKRAATPRHHDNYRLAAQLCDVAREGQRNDSESLVRIINAAKALGLSKSEVLTVLQKARLTA